MTSRRNLSQLHPLTRYSMLGISHLTFKTGFDSFTLISNRELHKSKSITINNDENNESFQVKACTERNTLLFAETASTIVSVHWYRKHNYADFYDRIHVHGFEHIQNIIQKYSDADVFDSCRCGLHFKLNNDKYCVLHKNDKKEIIGKTKNNTFAIIYPIGWHSVFIASIKIPKTYNYFGILYNKVHKQLFGAFDKAEYIGVSDFIDWFMMNPSEPYDFKLKE